MIISIIAAVSENNVIGNKGRIPWHLPADFAYFKEKTMGHHIIMGQKTFESIGKPLPGRTNIILSYDKSFTAKGCIVCHSLEEAIDYVKENQREILPPQSGVRMTRDIVQNDNISNNNEEVFIIGGASVYEQAIDIADKLYITRVKGAFKGDAYFPHIDAEKWKEISKIHYPKDENNTYSMEFIIYDKK